MLKNNKIKFVIALLGAICLWAYVLGFDGSSYGGTVRNIPVNYINAEALEKAGLVVLETPTEMVNISYTGQRSLKNKVQAKDFKATVDLEGLREGENTVKINVEKPENVDIKSVSVQKVTVVVDRLVQDGLSGHIRRTTGLVPDAYFSGTKIKWILDNVEGAREKAEAGKLLFGTVETWLIWNLTGGKVHVTDYSNASRTMLFDVDKLCWDEYLCSKLGIPMSMLPKPVPSSEIYGTVASDKVAGISLLKGVPISGAIGDQPAALFGQACFKPGQAKNTYGTGCFLLMNTGEKRVHSQCNLLTGVAWGIDGKVTYSIEGSAFNAGSVIKWLRDELQLISEARECDMLAESVPDSNGAYIVPAFTGLGAPYWDMYARGCIVGLTRGVNKAHIARAVLESITLQMKDLLIAMTKDSGIELTELRVDGGASVSNIMMQIQSNMIDAYVNRPKTVETTALGAAYLAGLAVGFWKDLDEIEENREVDRVFIPEMDKETREKIYKDWLKAVERAKSWEEN